MQTSDNMKYAIGFAVGLVVGLVGPGLVGKARAADKGGGGIFADAPLAPAKGSGLSAYVGAHAGVTIANTEVGFSGASLDGVGSHGVIGGVHAGADYTLPSRIFFGAYAFYDWQSTETSLKAGPINASVALGDSYGVGGRLGYDWGWAKTYALAGWRHTELSWDLPITPGGLPNGLTGLDLGAGISTPIAANIDLGLEGVWTRYNSETIGGPGGITLDPHQLSVMAKLNFRFGG
jgi:opacity protein-like surface antigen